MDRREFIGGMAASASLLQPGKILARAVPLPAATPSAQGAWLRGGLVDAGGTHEPYIFVVRRGGQRQDAKQIYEYEQSEGLIRQLHGQGVEVFHTHLYKGFGMAAEKEEMEETRRAVAFAHGLGMKADTYIQWNSMMYETFFAEEPRAINWIQRDIVGRPLLLTYGYQQSFRYRPCFSNPEYLGYLKKVVRYAVEDVRTDFIHFDNFDLNYEPDSCHCKYCTEGFRKFLREKYSDAERRERFGFANTDFVNPPQWNSDNPPDKLEIIYDPAIQEWVDFRCQLMANALKEISRYARSLRPEVAIEINPQGINGEDRTWTAGVDHSRLLVSTQAYCTEEDDPPAFHADGRLVSKIRSYKLARAYNNVLITYTGDDPVAMAEGLAFNQTPGDIGANPLPESTLRYIDFYRKRRDLYIGSEDVPFVAVYRSYASLTYHNAHAQLGAILAEQSLIQAHVPFGLVFDGQLHDLSRYKVLVLPETECLSDEQIAQIRRYVNAGGGLVAIGQAGLYDNWRRVRTQPGLTGMIEGQAPGTEYQETVKRRAHDVGATPSKKQYGAGRAVYLPALNFDGPMPPPQAYFAITNQFWRRPKNWKEFIDCVQWAAQDLSPFTVEGPEYLVANYTQQTKEHRSLIHLVNYNVTQVPSIKNVPVKVALPGNKKAGKMVLYAPEVDSPRTIPFRIKDQYLHCVVPEIHAYAVMAVQWQ